MKVIFLAGTPGALVRATQSVIDVFERSQDVVGSFSNENFSFHLNKLSRKQVHTGQFNQDH